MFVCVNSAAATPFYPFRSANAGLTVIHTEDIHYRSEQELLCLARNIYHEARGQSEANQRAVAWVTRNRARITNRTLCEVVFEHNRANGRKVAQFSWTLYVHNRPMERDAWDLAQRLAYQVWQASDHMDPTRGATHFHERTFRPVWSGRGVHHQTIGAHVFMRIPQYVQLAQAR
jgi:spore germination cell wall hydrolase CwlJ-like protein